MIFFGKRIVTAVRVDGMRCGGCARTVEKTLSSLPQVSKVTVDLETKTASVVSKKPLEEETVKELIQSVGFTFVGMESK